MTFAGHATFDMPDDVGEIVASNTFDQRAETAPFGSITLGDAENIVATSLGIRLDVPTLGYGSLPDIGNSLSHAVDAGTGLMSITVKNTGLDVLKGSFFASTSYDGWSSASPVPEAPVHALMLGGLALLGGMTRAPWHRRRQIPCQASAGLENLHRS